jgi:hypothetical protein
MNILLENKEKQLELNKKIKLRNSISCGEDVKRIGN